jgi:hypothetical protein
MMGRRRLAAGPGGIGFTLKRTRTLPLLSAPARNDTPAQGVSSPAVQNADQRHQQLGNQLYSVLSVMQPEQAGKITG